jgi:hypothetical protein
VDKAPPEPALRPVDSNPYAAPRPTDDNPEFDLTEYGAKRVRGVVGDANLVLPVVLISCVCMPAWFLTFPWYVYRTYCWYQLNATYSELRHPNSFSPHASLAIGFQEAYGKLILGVAVGGILWILLAMFFLARALT